MTKTEMINKITSGEIYIIKFVDETNYDSNLCNNGGCYSYTITYTLIANDTWEMTESTSGEFCPYCNSWNCSGECMEDTYPTRTTADVIAVVESTDYYGAEIDGEILTIWLDESNDESGYDEWEE